MKLSTYAGLTVNQFKIRFRNRTASFKNVNEKKRNRVEQTLIPKGQQNGIFCDLENNGSCQKVFKSVKKDANRARVP